MQTQQLNQEQTDSLSIDYVVNDISHPVTYEEMVNVLSHKHDPAMLERLIGQYGLTDDEFLRIEAHTRFTNDYVEYLISFTSKLYVLDYPYQEQQLGRIECSTCDEPFTTNTGLIPLEAMDFSSEHLLRRSMLVALGFPQDL